MARYEQLIKVEEEQKEQEIFIIPEETEQLVEVIPELLSSSEAYPIYEGTYVVIPQTSEQTLETRDKRMQDNVTVREVPYFEVSNEKGLTVYIAQNIND